MEQTSARNMRRQIVTLKDGRLKNVFHKKQFHSMDFKSYWNMLDKQPRENSKRQIRLREEAEKQASTA